MVKTCADRVAAAMESRLEDIRFFHKFDWIYDKEELVLNNYDVKPEDLEKFDEIGEFNSYGLSFEWQDGDEPDAGPTAGFYKFVLSTGGPHEEFRFYGDGRITFVLKDWFDFAEVPCGEEAVFSMGAHFAECEMMPKFDDIVRW